MNVEYTGRHYEVTSTIRKEVETGLAKIRKILGDRFEAKVILAVEKHRHKAEITISPRNGPLVGLAQAKDMTIAVNEALEHLEKQAIKYKTKWQSKKRSARKTEEDNKKNCRPRSACRKKRPFPWSCISIPRWRRPPRSTSCVRTTPSPCGR